MSPQAAAALVILSAGEARALKLSLSAAGACDINSPEALPAFSSDSPQGQSPAIFPGRPIGPELCLCVQLLGHAGAL